MLWWVLLLSPFAHAQEASGDSGDFSSEAGWVGMIVSIIVGSAVAAERLRGVFKSSDNKSEDDEVDLGPITTRLTSVETRLDSIEVTVTSIDTHNRNETASVARMEGRMSDWGERLARIETLIQGIAARNQG